MKTRIFLLSLFASFCISLNATPPSEEGKTIFTARCAACHNINQQLTGPALAGVYDRRSIDWIIKFVHSSQTVVKSGDQYAVALFEKFNKIPMPDHADLTDDNIKSIVEYVKSESKTGTDKETFAKPGKLRPNYLPLFISKDYAFFLGFLAAVGVLIFVLLFAVEVSALKRKKI